MDEAPPLPAKPPTWLAIASTLGLTALAAFVARFSAPFLDASSLSLFFVAPIVVLAIRFGAGASIAAALLSTLAINFLFVEPRYTFVVARPQDAAALVLFAAVALMVSTLAAQARAEAHRARLRAWESVLLRDFARQLSTASDDGAIADAVIATVSRLTCAAVALISADGRSLGAPTDAAASEAAKWCMSTKAPVSPSNESATGAPWSFWPIVTSGYASWAIGVSNALPVGLETTIAISQVAAQAGVAFERARISQLAERARMDAEREKLKSELLAGVSHDLRTPLATLVLTLQSLQHFAAEHASQARQELLALAEQEARRLAAMVDALLDASRLEAGASPVQLETVEVNALVEQALDLADLRDAKVEMHGDGATHVVRIDPVLAARALANILENSVRHGGAGLIRIDLRGDANNVLLEVSDDGPGLGEDAERLFEKFVRGGSSDGRAPGLGLGLSIARGLIESQGGAISARNGDEGGAVFRMTLKASADG